MGNKGSKQWKIKRKSNTQKMVEKTKKGNRPKTLKSKFEEEWIDRPYKGNGGMGHHKTWYMRDGGREDIITLASLNLGGAYENHSRFWYRDEEIWIRYSIKPRKKNDLTNCGNWNYGQV